MKNLFAKKKGRKVVEKGATENPMTSTEEKNKKPVTGCKMIMCEDPLTGVYRLFPVKCPPGYVEKMRSKMREKGVKFSKEPLPEDVFLNNQKE